MSDSLRYVMPGVALAIFLVGCSGTAAPPLPETHVATRTAHSSTYRCGDHVIEVSFADSSATLELEGGSVTVFPVRSASGVRYRNKNRDQAIEFFEEGAVATLELNGQRFPECQRTALAGIALPFRGSGNEPFWNVEISNEALLLARNLGSNMLDVPAYTLERTEKTVHVVPWTSTGNGMDERFSVDIHERLCHDSMSGMVYPYEVVVMTESEELRGCGGESASLLLETEWLIEDIDRKGIIDRSRVSMTFVADGRLSGNAGCNRYTASYQLTGEGLTFASIASTRMACPAALMNQEARFLQLLADVVRFDFTTDGALLLQTASDELIRARHSTEQ